jgi:glycosyltransferase involved in cell wall biosynthesis
MKVTVIIPTIQKNEPYLRKTVESLRAAEASKNWDIIVVSNGGPYYPLVDLKATRRLHITPQGQCIAVNYGAQLVSPDTKYIMVSNDDMYYAPDWGQNLRFDHLCFSPNLVEPTNNAGSAEPFLKLDAGFTLDEFNQQGVDEFVSSIISHSGHEEVSETTGFNLPFFIRKDVWETIGGYDEKYDPWGSNSDTDLQTLIELSGVQPMRLRDVLVYHFSNKSGTFDGTHQKEWQENFDYYGQKFGFTRDDDPKPNTWMATGLVNQALNTFHPAWEGKYRD